MILFGLAKSELVKAGNEVGLRTANEVFADRTYQQDGTLTSRRQPNALISDHQQAVRQVIRMVKEGVVTSEQGVDVQIHADTVCLHGDGPDALTFAKTIRSALADEGIRVQSL